MSLFQETIFSIIEDIKEAHNSYESIKVDPYYLSWLKLAKDKRGLQRKVREHFAEKERVRQLELFNAPKYF